METRSYFKGNRKYKDRLFRLLFSEKEHLLELYNALNGSHYSDAEELEVTTLDDVLYMKMKNDVSILLDDHLSLYEHQSTLNPNLQFRGFLYFAELYRQLIGSQNIYSTRQIPLPTPAYIVFYNGTQKMEEEAVLRLSDAFTHKEQEPVMELKARVLNINYGHNKKLMEQSRTLRDYSILVGKVKTLSREMELGQAIDRAIEECIEENVLHDFLVRRRNEVKNSILTEYDEERVLAELSRESYEDGEKAGYVDGQKAGYTDGEKQFARLAQALLEAGRIEDLSRATTDKDYREKMYKEYDM